MSDSLDAKRFLPLISDATEFFPVLDDLTQEP